ncbi:MAG: ATP-dependent DNA helicase RecG [Armatimonadetes bacterium]|nr:ATP-dependent DNA helicase RecG [Armatimonadota bacterium]MDW8153422.1 ATP-dependent DNA helicase RecG [Armatimonadota bacterium]
MGQEDANTTPRMPAGQGGLQQGVEAVRGVGPALAEQLRRLGLHTVEDLLYHLPRRYEDRRHFSRLYDAPHGEYRTFRATVVRLHTPQLRTGRTLTEVYVTDGTAVGVLKFWGNRHLHRTLQPRTEIVVWGRVRRAFGQIEIENPEFEVLTKGAASFLHTGRIVPVHSVTEGLSPRLLRRVIYTAVQQFAPWVSETLPEGIRKRFGLPSLPQAFKAVHFPASLPEAEAARRRLAFEELLILQLALLLRQREVRAAMKPHRYRTEGKMLEAFFVSLPFSLTRAQQRVIGEIARDMYSPHPMNRLLQGDVGSGKTAVAAAAVVIAVQGGYQAAVMAPTEILAEQHYLTFRRLLEPLGIRTVLLTGGLGRGEREVRRAEIASGEVDLVVGTHALLQEDVTFHRLALVIVDEQHKFGVAQRAALRQKARDPDVLVMTATPIPRTLALTLYGDLDISVLDELPPGRVPVRTYLRTPQDRERIYAFVRREVEGGRQAYIVCPLVEESERLDVQAAVELYEDLRSRVFPDLRVGIVHGRMGVEEKERVMQAFRAGEISVLVATPVIEVGVDVPNATVMVVEHAERFGLAQLHQLRGRVGRGGQKAYCILIAEPSTEEGRQRLEALARTTDGFEIAQVDLELRGPGELFGTRQHGLPDFRVANPLRDGALLERSREAASLLLAADPRLERPEHQALRRALLARYEGSAALLAVG